MTAQVNSPQKILDYFNNNDIDVELLQNEDNQNLFNFSFPREHQDVEVTLEEIEKFATEIETLEVTNLYARTKSIIQFPIYNDEWSDLVSAPQHFIFQNEEFTISIVEYPLLIAIANVKLSLYSKHAGPLTTYNAIEIKNKKCNLIELTHGKDLAMSFIFEFYQAAQKVLEIVELHDFDSDYYNFDEDDEVDDAKQIEIVELIRFNEAISLFLKATKTDDDEIRFLYFYKIIEHFSPKIAKLKTYDILTKKLDSIRYKKITDYELNQVIDISDSLRKSKSDSDLGKTVLSIGIDVIDLFQFLPESIKSSICKESKLNQDSIKYGLDQNYIDSIIQKVGKWLYSTRNHIVHAKSNYNSDNYECKTEDLKQMNIFLSKATYQIIKWNDSLPI